MSILMACPLLPSADLKRSVDYYVRKLGFTRVNLQEGFAIVERDGCEVHFWPCADKHVMENSGCYIRVNDIEGVHASMKAASDGGRISKPCEREWGMREFYVWDCDGNLLRFGQPTGTH